MTDALRAGQRRVVPLPHQGAGPGAAPRPVSNAGLELDRYLPAAIGGGNVALPRLLDRVCNSSPPKRLYAAAYRRWRDLLAAQAATDPNQPTVSAIACRVQNRLIVGLGADSVRDAAIALQRAYGVPLVPGSALKGLARHFAEAALPATNPANQSDTEWKANVQRALFGDQTDAAQVVYFDAWYVPGSALDDRPLRRDVMTVHHAAYYGSQGRSGPGPWDLDDPIPVPFVSAMGSYLVAVRGPDRAWTEFALALLCRALAEWGVGAKTSSGYGRLIAPSQPDTAPPTTEHSLLRQVHALLTEPEARFRSMVGGMYAQWQAMDDPEVKRQIAVLILDHIDANPALARWERQKERNWAIVMRAFLASDRAT